MERIRSLDRYPKLLLIALLLIAVVFTAVYGFAASRVGYLHKDAIFVPRQEAGGTKTYGPYTIFISSATPPLRWPKIHYIIKKCVQI